MTVFSLAEYRERTDRLQAVLKAKGIDLAIISQNSDIYYYTGSAQPLYFVLPVSGQGFVLARKAIAQIESEARNVKLEVFSNTKDLTAIIGRYQLDQAKRIGFTLETISYASVERLRRLFSGADVADLSWDIRSLRTVKSEAEIAIQAKAGEIMARLPEVVKAGFRPGMSELDLSVVIEKFMRENGHAGIVSCRREGIQIGLGVCTAGVNSLAGTKFDGVCTGKGISPAVPYGAGNEPIPKGVPVALDYAFNLEGYHIDQTRMFCWGEPSEQFQKAYQAMVKIEAEILEMMKPGMTWESAYRRAVQMAEEFGYGEEFMGFGPEKVRFIGHGIGLELDEPPFIAGKMEQQLEENMVVAVEPKVALAGTGVIGIEDTVVIERAGCRLLTPCSREIIVV